MSTRHSFLSTTSLIRKGSSASTISSYPAPSRTAKPDDQVSSSRFFREKRKNLKNLTLVPPSVPAPMPVESKLHLCIRHHAGVVPLGPTFTVGIAIVISLFFIASIAFAFVGAEDEPVFKDTLDNLAQSNPGILLIGDNVDVDVDEPAVTVRWSIVACGQAFVLAGSEGTHGSSSCGIPNVPLNIYVDGDSDPTATYDPNKIPTTSSQFNRLSVQNLYQFDSDHVLDVHEARLYPFDSYHLTSNIRIEVANSSTPTPVTRLLTLTDTSSFIISSSDVASTVALVSSSSNDSPAESPSRDLDLTIKRPGEARFFALMLFGISWMLAHSTVGYVALAWRTSGSQRPAFYLILTVVTMLVIPQLRNAMPDAPGYDGVLIDQIGFFSQMTLTGITTITLLATVAKRELVQLESPAPTIPGSGLLEHGNNDKKNTTAAEGLKKLRTSGASIDFRHIRSLSKKFLTTLEPPSPITEQPLSPIGEYPPSPISPFNEYSEKRSLLDPLAASPIRGHAQYDKRGPVDGPQFPAGPNPAAPSIVTYSEWV